MINDNLDDYLDNDNSSPRINPETARYLAHHEQKLYQEIETRKRFEAGLLFLCCQIGSASLAWLLFSLQTTLIIIQVSAIALAMLPGLIDFSDSFSFELSSERWEVKHSRPMQSVGKLLIGGAVGWTSTKRISEAVFKTHQQIETTYKEIREAQTPKTTTANNQYDLIGWCVLGVVGLLIFSKMITSLFSEPSK
ncbi:hypothetical protein [Anabaena sp. CCY 9910]|uniref:hypothetical protein n=1 Tax=Anabaena sp. CCY 9910 TaxID=3103870 RepID=UPI0039E10EC6